MFLYISQKFQQLNLYCYYRCVPFAPGSNRKCSCHTDAPVALPLYDYLLTLDEEKTYIWGEKFSGATAIYYLNRYLLLVSSVLLCTTFFPVQTDLVSAYSS